MTKTTEEKPLSLIVEIGGVSPGEETSAIGIRVSRNRIPVAKAVQTFVGKRLGVVLRSTPNGGEDAAQTHKPDDAYEEVTGHADVKRVGISPGEIGFRLSFSNGEVSPHDLLDIQRRNGLLIVNSVEEIPEPTPEERAEHTPARNGAPKANTTGKDEGIGQPISALVEFGLPERLVSNVVDACSGDTIGHLEIRQRLKPSTWMKEIAGCGGKSQELLVEAYEAFRRKFPMVEKGEEAELPF